MGNVILGTTQGISYPDCHVGATTGAKSWQDFLIGNTLKASVSVLYYWSSSGTGNDTLAMKSAEKGLWVTTARSMAEPPWAQVTGAGINVSAGFVAVAEYQEAFFAAGAKDGIWFGLSGATMNAVIPVSASQKGLPPLVASAEIGGLVPLEVRSLAVFGARLFIGTSVGILEYDRMRALGCLEGSLADSCLGPP